MVSVVVVSVLFVMRFAGTWLVRKDVPVKADVMVMLMGSIPDRVLEASDLYRAGYAKKIILVEENMGSYRKLEERGAKILSNTTQCFNALVKLGVQTNDITILPGDAQSTQAEAIIVRDFLKGRQETERLILVTSPGHTRRSWIIFSQAFRKSGMKTRIIAVPSKYNAFSGHGWWKHKETIQTVTQEYIKLFSYFVFERRRLDAV